MGELTEKAYDFATELHTGQTRLSGRPYVEHPRSVGEILDGLGLDETTVAAGYLHDVLEDTGVSYETLSEAFGPDVARLVLAVTKLKGIEGASDEAYRDADLQRMFVAMAGDLRVVFIKLADRLDNLRSLGYLSPERRYDIARESLYLFAPLADRLGLGQIRWEVEDLAFRYLEPEVYKVLAGKVTERRSEREARVAAAVSELVGLLAEAGVVAKVTGRPKHLYGIRRKMERDGRGFDEIYDLLGVRVIVETVADCYRALDVVHATYDYVEERYRDFIARPKPNMYQSLHTTVLVSAGDLLEVQIRNSAMHSVAEYGVAAHWLYKRDKEGLPLARPPVLEWMSEAAGGIADGPVPELMEAFFADLVKDDVFVFTPAGDVKRLPEGATPIDFAYAVHTMVGHRCAGAKVNGSIASTRTKLRTGDRVEIITSQRSEPSRDWMEFVCSSSARSKIRAFFRRKGHAELIELGREALSRERERLGRRAAETPSEASLTEYAIAHGHSTLENLLVRLGEGAVSASAVLSTFYPTPERAKPMPAVLPDYAGYVSVAGLDGLELKIAGCCRPIPLVPIVGYVTAAGYVSVHRAGCRSLSRRAAGRIHPAAWVMDDVLGREVSIRITVRGGREELADVVRSLDDAGVRLVALTGEPPPGDGTAVIVLHAPSAGRVKSLKKELDRNPVVARVEVIG